MNSKFFVYALLVTSLSTATSWYKMLTTNPNNGQGSSFSPRTGSTGYYGGGGYSGGGGGGHK